MILALTVYPRGEGRFGEGARTAVLLPVPRAIRASGSVAFVSETLGRSQKDCSRVGGAG